MQAEREHERIGEGVRDPVGVEQRRHLRLARDAVQALGDVEHEIPALARQQPRHQRGQLADPDRRVAELRKRARRWPSIVSAPVELGRLFLAEALGQVVVAAGRT